MDSDVARFRELYEAYFDTVSRYAGARAGPDMAKDATAQTFLVAWRRRTEFFSARYPIGWLLGVTRRTLADERRAESRQARLCDRIAAAEPAVAPPPRDPAAVVTDRDAVMAAFSALRDGDREVLSLVAWDGLSPGEAAGVLGCSRAAFAVRLHRARSRLQAQLRLLGADFLPARRATPVLTSMCTDEGTHS